MEDRWINKPCKLCRKEAIPISQDGEYCVICYKELLTEALFK